MCECYSLTVNKKLHRQVQLLQFIIEFREECTRTREGLVCSKGHINGHRRVPSSTAKYWGSGFSIWVVVECLRIPVAVLLP